MSSEVLVNEPVDVLYRVMPNGEARPTSFVWRNKTRYVNDIGRTWEERVQGQTLRCYMIQAVDGDTFEVRYEAGNDQWLIYRAWLRDLVA